MPPRVSESGGRLSLEDRAQLQWLLSQQPRPSLRAIAAQLGRAPSTITRELVRAGVDPKDPVGYQAARAQRLAQDNARAAGAARHAGRPLKLSPGSRLWAEVVSGLKQRHSPEQIAHRLRTDFPDDPEMRVSHETIYQALYVQGRGSLRAQVGDALRSGRARRIPRGAARAGKHAKIVGMVNISERPAEADDRAVPGHWEGDLIIGAGNQSAIGTLVERSTRFVMLLHLPNGHTAEQVEQAMTAKIMTLPEHLRRSLTWDQGSEMARHASFSLATGIPVYFCDPRSPWQRGSNENTNGLLRQYFPKSTDLSLHGPGILDNVAAELNGRPRKTLGWATPAEKLNKLLNQQNVA
uniref:IS30 family transposase n=1 Tax=Luteipulveratus halotolerans TaxID=1631356 RepID=UPI001E5C6E53|nr:IS30 family transposase [Luteipulveratus halotolerans]